jgi:hypothetical protein
VTGSSSASASGAWFISTVIGGSGCLDDNAVAACELEGPAPVTVRCARCADDEAVGWGTSISVTASSSASSAAASFARSCSSVGKRIFGLRLVRVRRLDGDMPARRRMSASLRLSSSSSASPSSKRRNIFFPRLNDLLKSYQWKWCV